MARIIIPLITLVVLVHSYVLPGIPTDQRTRAQTTTRPPTYQEAQPGNVAGGETGNVTGGSSEEGEGVAGEEVSGGEYPLQNSGKYCCSYRPAEVSITEPRQVVGTETYVITWNAQVGEQICEPREWLWHTSRWRRCPILEQKSRINTRTVMTTIYETTTRVEACRDEAIVCCSPLQTIVPPWGGEPLCVDQQTYSRISGLIG